MTRILIVDDSAQVRNALRICLQMNRGHEVCGEAENGRDGVELAKRLQPDIVLLDYAMPTMNRVGSRPTHLVINADLCADFVHHVRLGPTFNFGASRWCAKVISKDVGGVDAIIRAIETITWEAA